MIYIITPTAYLDCADFEGYVGPIGESDIPHARQFLTAASRVVDDWTRRIFYQWTGKLEVDTWEAGQQEYPLPLDCLTLTGLWADVYGDLSFAHDLYLDAHYLKVFLPARPPYHTLEIRPSPPVAIGNRRLRLEGEWGWPRELRGGSLVQDNPLPAEATTIMVASSAPFAAGQTVLVGNEQIYVEHVAGPSTLAVRRGINGTVAAVHAQGSLIRPIVYPGPIQQVTGAIAARLWKRRDTAWAAAISDEGPTIEAASLLDGSLRALLSSYRKYTV